jgi:hypothetical protein
MPIRPLLGAETGVFGPEDIEVIVTAFDEALRTLNLVDRDDPVVMMLAKLTIEVAKQGERDPVRLRERVLRLMSIY